MKQITLVRLCTKPITLGVLMDTVPFAVTLEDPWMNNQQNISCIPFGRYFCTRILSPKFGQTWTVTNVHNRSAILFHKGNNASDTSGCILVASSFSLSSISGSQEGFKIFLERLEREQIFELLIKEL